MLTKEPVQTGIKKIGVGHIGRPVPFPGGRCLGQPHDGCEVHAEHARYHANLGGLIRIVGKTDRVLARSFMPNCVGGIFLLLAGAFDPWANYHLAGFHINAAKAFMDALTVRLAALHEMDL